MSGLDAPAHSSEDMCFLDVNVPMYAAGQAHPYRDACAWLMGEVTAGHLVVAVDTEIIQEILYRYGALRRIDLAVALATEVLNLIPNVLPISRDDALLSVDLFRQYGKGGITARDVLHAAVMQNHHLQQIITTDTHFETITGITRLDPLLMFKQAHAG